MRVCAGRVGPRGERGDGACGGVEHLGQTQGGQCSVVTAAGDDGGEDPVVVREHHGLVAGVDVDLAEGEVHRPRLGPGAKAVLAGDVGDTAVPTACRSAEIVAETAGATGRGDDQIGVQPPALGADPGGPAAGGAHLVDVAGVQDQARLALGGRPQDPLEGRAAAAHRHQLLGSVRAFRTGRSGDRLGAGGEQVVPDLGDLRLQRLDHLRAEGVRVVELHHPAPLPRPVRARAGVPIDDGDRVTPPGQRHGGEQPRRPGPHDNDTHDPSPAPRPWTAPWGGAAAGRGDTPGTPAVRGQRQGPRGRVRHRRRRAHRGRRRLRAGRLRW